MGLPIISEIWDGIRWAIDFFFDKAPRPVQYLVFLLMLLLVGNVIVGGLQLLGVHCNQKYQPVKTSVFDVTTNVFVFYETTLGSMFSEPSVTFEDVHTYSGVVGDTCYFALYNDSGNLTVCDNPTTNASCRYYYNFRPTTDSNVDRGCSVCNHTNLGWVDDDSSIFGVAHIGDVCIDDAYPPEPFSMDWLYCAALCDIPENYRFSFDNGTYICTDLDYCGVNATIESDYAFNTRLKRANAELMYPTIEEKSYRRFVGITCNGDFTPRFAVFGIDVFDFKIWVLLTIIGLLVWGLRIATQ
jgi:hypothetical protein